MKFLFYGFGSEYVLHDLYLDFKKDGFECIEIEALTNKNSKKIIQKLKGEKIVFITSAHFLLDLSNFKEFYSAPFEFYGVLEILSLLKPVAKIFIPHDLTEPLIQYEELYLNQFDFFISPHREYSYRYNQFCSCPELGWIKMKNSRKKPYEFGNRHFPAIWFLSDFILHRKMGPEKSFLQNAPLLDQGVSIKFPFWNGHHEFEQYYRKKGATVFDAEVPTTDLIQLHDVIITNGVSSLIAESYWQGKQVVNIQQNSHYGDKLLRLKKRFPDVIFVDELENFHLQDVPKTERNSGTLKPFDIKTFKKTVLEFIS